MGNFWLRVTDSNLAKPLDCSDFRFEILLIHHVAPPMRRVFRTRIEDWFSSSCDGLGLQSALKTTEEDGMGMWGLATSEYIVTLMKVNSQTR